jgi:hypothetical protein
MRPQLCQSFHHPFHLCREIAIEGAHIASWRERGAGGARYDMQRSLGSSGRKVRNFCAVSSSGTAMSAQRVTISPAASSESLPVVLRKTNGGSASGRNDTTRISERARRIWTLWQWTQCSLPNGSGSVMRGTN